MIILSALLTAVLLIGVIVVIVVKKIKKTDTVQLELKVAEQATQEIKTESTPRGVAGSPDQLKKRIDSFE